MNKKFPVVSVDILIVRENKILLGLLNKKWSLNGQQVYGLPGKEIRFGEKIGNTVERNIKEDIDCKVIKYEIICVNANYALGNHYIGIGVVINIEGEPKNLIPEDWERWEWFDKNNIPSNLFPAAKNLIECYLKDKVCISE